MDDRPTAATTEPQAEELFRIETRSGPSETILALAGQIGLEAAGPLKAEAMRLAENSGEVAVDWRGCGHVGLAGVQVLLALDVALAGKGRKLHVAMDNPDVRHFLELAGLSGRFPCAVREA